MNVFKEQNFLYVISRSWTIYFKTSQSIFTLLLKWKQECFLWYDTSCTRKQVEWLTSRFLSRNSKQIWCGHRFPVQIYSPGATTLHRWLRGWFEPGQGLASTSRPSGSIRTHCDLMHKSQCGWTLGPSQFLQTRQSFCLSGITVHWCESYHKNSYKITLPITLHCWVNKYFFAFHSIMGKFYETI